MVEEIEYLGQNHGTLSRVNLVVVEKPCLHSNIENKLKGNQNYEKPYSFKLSALPPAELRSFQDRQMDLYQLQRYCWHLIFFLFRVKVN